MGGEGEGRTSPLARAEGPLTAAKKERGEPRLALSGKAPSRLCRSPPSLVQRGRKNRGGLLPSSGLEGGPTGQHPSRLEGLRAVARTLTLLLIPTKMAFKLWYRSLVPIVRAFCFRGSKVNPLSRGGKWFGFETQRWARSGLSSGNKRGESFLGATSPVTRLPCQLQKLEPLLKFRTLEWLPNLCIHFQKEGIEGTQVGLPPKARCWLPRRVALFDRRSHHRRQALHGSPRSRSY